MPDVSWTSGRRNMVLDAEDRLLHPKDAGGTPLLRSGRNVAVRVDEGLVVGAYTTGWVSFPPVPLNAPACCVGVRGEEHDPSKPIIVALDGNRLRLLPGTATDLIRDAIGGGRFEGEQARTVEFYDPNDLSQKSVTIYVMGTRVPGVGQVRYMAFARDIPRLPWRIEGTEGWRHWIGVPLVKDHFVREDFGVVLQIFPRDPLVDPEFGDTAMVQLPWSGAPYRRDQNGLTYLWFRGRVLEVSVDCNMARLERQTGRTVTVLRDSFRDMARLASLFEAKAAPAEPAAAEPEAEVEPAVEAEPTKPKRARKKS